MAHLKCEVRMAKRRLEGEREDCKKPGKEFHDATWDCRQVEQALNAQSGNSVPSTWGDGSELPVGAPPALSAKGRTRACWSSSTLTLGCEGRGLYPYAATPTGPELDALLEPPLVLSKRLVQR